MTHTSKYIYAFSPLMFLYPLWNCKGQRIKVSLWKRKIIDLSFFSFNSVYHGHCCRCCRYSYLFYESRKFKLQNHAKSQLARRSILRNGFRQKNHQLMSMPDIDLSTCLKELKLFKWSFHANPDLFNVNGHRGKRVDFLPSDFIHMR